MIESFTLPASPALARRFAHLAAVNGTPLDPSLAALAATGRVDPADYPDLPGIEPAVLAAVQNLVDVDLRGVLRTGDRARGCEAVILACRVAQATPILVATDDPQTWTRAHRTWASAAIEIASWPDLCEHARIDRHRAGVLILDLSHSGYGRDGQLCGLALEFNRTIFVVAAEDHHRAYDSAGKLYPDLPGLARSIGRAAQPVLTNPRNKSTNRDFLFNITSI